MSKSPEIPGAQAIRRALRILKSLGAGDDAGLTVKAVTERLGLERSTAHRLLTCLVDEGFAARGDRRRYHLGIESMRLGFASMSRMPILQSYGHLLRRLAGVTGDTAYLMLRHGDYAHCVAREDGGPRISVFATRVGDIRPLGIGVGGMALLAASDAATVARILRHHGQAFEEAGLGEGILQRVIARTRRLGYAEMLDTVTHGVAGVAAVIPVAGGVPFAAITLAAPNARMPAQRRTELGRYLADQLAVPSGPSAASATASAAATGSALASAEGPDLVGHRGGEGRLVDVQRQPDQPMPR